MPSFFGKNRQVKRNLLVQQITIELTDRELGPEGSKFIPLHAVEDILTEDRLHKLFEKLPWYKAERVTNIALHSKRIIAILIRFGWEKWDELPQFLSPSKSFEPSSSNFTDQQLPIREQDLREKLIGIESLKLRPLLYYQYDFAPLLIRESTYEKYAAETRLPYVREPVAVGDGAFGSVYKVTIAKGCLRKGQNHEDSNHQVSI